MAIIVNDHDKLHQSVARAALAGGAAALIGLFVPGPIAQAVMALAVGVAVAVPASRLSAASAVLWACAAGGAARFGGPIGQALGALAIGATLARGLAGRERRLVAAVLGALGAAAAALVTRAFDRTGALDALPAGPAALVVGALGGAVIGVSSIGRHLERTAARLGSELDALGGEGELGELLGRAALAYRAAVEALGPGAPQARAAADDLMKRMARFGRRWREVEAEAGRLPSDLDDQVLRLEGRIAASDDPITRAELARAHEALRAQRESLAEIRRGRERAVARLTHQVATLERLRLAALRHRTVDASRMGAELQPLVDELTEAGGDLDLASEALDEAVRASALPAAR